MSLSTHNGLSLAELTDAGSPFRSAAAGDVFGEGSVVCIPSAAETGMLPPVADPLFQILLLTLLLCTVLTIRASRRTGFFAAIFSHAMSDNFASGRRNGVLPNGFLNVAALTASLTVVVMAAAWCDFLLPESLGADSGISPFVVAAAAAAAVAATVAYQRLLLAAIGFISRSREFVDAVVYVKKTFFAAVALIVAPLFIVSSLSFGDGRIWWFRIIAALCCIVALLFMKETCILFVRKKVSILQWFLYLCAVEAFPLSLVFASIARFR